MYIIERRVNGCERRFNGWFIMSGNNLVFTGVQDYPYFSPLRSLLNEVSYGGIQAIVVAKRIEIARSNINVNL